LSFGTASEKVTTMPLRDIKVLEIGTMITAPLAAMMLADFGAQVTKIEQPGGGDPFRKFGDGTYSPNFIAFNRGKRSVALNLQSEGGKAVFEKLLQSADVLIENVRPGKMERLGFSPARLRARFPRLVHCSITGFGASGPYKDRPAYDTVGIAISGIGSLQIDPDKPALVGPTIADNVTGMFACYGIMGALYEAKQTGQGRHVEVNMLEASMAFIPDPIAHFTRTGHVYNRLTRVAASQSYAAKCQDGVVLAVHLSNADKLWLKLVEALDRPALLGDVRFATRAARISHYAVIQDIIGEHFAGASSAFWSARLTSFDIPFAPVLNIPQLAADPQIAHLQTFSTTRHPTEGEVTSLMSPVRLDGERRHVAAPPTLGEHTEATLGELGYDAAAIADMRLNGVIG
jgi:crotonobetainyl-CoA:carnitine CoA-transferase CaiB-like acyl-CoA transferase